MFRRFLPLLLVVISVLLDVSAIPVFIQSYVVPLITLCTVIALGLLLGRTQGTLYGLIGGMFVDVLVNDPIGLMMVLYLGCGYIAGIASRKFSVYLLMPVITPIICFSMFELILMGYLFFYGVELNRDFLIQVGSRILIEVVLVQVLYLFYNRLLRPQWPRFAPRSTGGGNL